MLGNADLCLMELEQDHPAKRGVDDIISGIEKMRELIEEIKYSNAIQDSENEIYNIIPLSNQYENSNG
jgi:uncharacterized protein YwgA